MIVPSPLQQAAELEALALMVSAPDPASLFAEATEPVTRGLHLFAAEKVRFDAVQRLLGILLESRVSQPVAVRWILAYVLEDPSAFAEAVRRRRAAR